MHDTRSHTKQEAFANEHAGKHEIALYTSKCTTTRSHTRQEVIADEHAEKHKVVHYTFQVHCESRSGHVRKLKLKVLAQESAREHKEPISIFIMLVPYNTL